MSNYVIINIFSIVKHTNALTVNIIFAKQDQWVFVNHPLVMNEHVQGLCGISAAAASRILARLTKEEKLKKICEDNHWAYRMNLLL